MKKYFVTSDVHGFKDILTSDLVCNNFMFSNPDHILVICGDILDRGKQAKDLVSLLLDLKKQGRLILVRGNHEDLINDCLNALEQRTDIGIHHFTNGTVDSIEQLTGVNKYDLACGLYNFRELKEKMTDYFELVKDSVDYYEIGDYVLVHGWVPYVLVDTNCSLEPRIMLDAGKDMWDKARWLNGMREADAGVIIPNKTIICGHYHTGWGHKNIYKTHSDEFDCFDIYKNKGIIALDSCVAYSHKLNIFVIEEE